jgi:hypothetical protein
MCDSRSLFKILQRPLASIETDTHRLALSIYFGDRLWIASALSRLLKEVSDGRIVVLSTLESDKFDETPLRLRSNENCPSLNSSLQLLAPIADSQADASSTALAVFSPGSIELDGPLKRYSHDNQAGCAKVYQFHRCYGILIYVVKDDCYKCIKIPKSTSLGVADSSCADTLKHLCDLQGDQPMWPMIRSKALFNIDVSSNDSAVSNIRHNTYECRAIEGVDNHSRFRFACRVHIGSNATLRVYTCVGPMISGVMALSSAQSPGGATCKYRDTVERYLFEFGEVVPCEPPNAQDPRFIYRKMVLDLCLGKSKRDRLRRTTLEVNLTGCWLVRGAPVWHTLESKPKKRLWARQTAWALFPSRISMFPGHRWLTKTDSVTDTTLLACCNELLDEVTPRWLAIMTGKKYTTPQTIQPRASWEPDFSDDIVNHSDAANTSDPTRDDNFDLEPPSAFQRRPGAGED